MRYVEDSRIRRRMVCGGVRRAGGLRAAGSLRDACVPRNDARADVSAGLVGRVAQARAALERDPGNPDVAALLLDGVVARLCDAYGVAVADLGRPPAVGPAAGDEVVWRLRLALRAPDVRARLVHCEQLLGRNSGAAAPRDR